MKNTGNGRLLPLVLSAAFMVIGQPSFAKKAPLTTPETSNKYLPHLQVGATRFFNVKGSDNSGVGLDFFVPLLQSPSEMLFTDARIYDRSGKPFEGNLHLGYRYLDQEKQHLYGIYGAFDRKRTGNGNYFNQLMVGAECWLDRFFIGGNFYQPIGSKAKYLGLTNEKDVYEKVSQNVGNIWKTGDGRSEKAAGGVDGEVGYELIDGLTGYVGGYYFKAKDVASIYGPKAKISYDFALKNGKRILGILDKVGVESGVQHDKPRGTTYFLSANLRVGLLPNRNGNLQGVARHMVDLVRRDVDIVSAESVKKEKQKIGKVVVVNTPEEFAAALKSDATHISVNGDLTNNDQKIHEALDNVVDKKEIVFGNKIDVMSTKGIALPLDISANAGSNGVVSNKILNKLESSPETIKVSAYGLSEVKKKAATLPLIKEQSSPIKVAINNEPTKPGIVNKIKNNAKSYYDSLTKTPAQPQVEQKPATTENAAKEQIPSVNMVASNEPAKASIINKIKDSADYYWNYWTKTPAQPQVEQMLAAATPDIANKEVATDRWSIKAKSFLVGTGVAAVGAAVLYTGVKYKAFSQYQIQNMENLQQREQEIANTVIKPEDSVFNIEQLRIELKQTQEQKSLQKPVSLSFFIESWFF